jgi:uncharacterized protein (DUF1330 family)
MKAYWIAHVDVSDAEQYTQYTQRAPAAFAEVRRTVPGQGRAQRSDGRRPTPQRSVVIEFDSYEQAVACYQSAEYQAAKAHREGVAQARSLSSKGWCLEGGRPSLSPGST